MQEEDICDDCGLDRLCWASTNTIEYTCALLVVKESAGARKAL